MAGAATLAAQRVIKSICVGSGFRKGGGGEAPRDDRAWLMQLAE